MVLNEYEVVKTNDLISHVTEQEIKLIEQEIKLMRLTLCLSKVEQINVMYAATLVRAYKNERLQYELS